MAEIQISGAALRHNLAALRSLTSQGQGTAVVVKGNAYGHGLREVVQALKGEVDLFQVDDLDELSDLRSETEARVMVLGYLTYGEIEEALRLGAELGAFDTDYLGQIGAASRKLGVRARVHLEIDALLGRLGVLPSDAAALLDVLAACPEISPVSAYAHFANIEDTTDLGHALAQMEAFEAAYRVLVKAMPKLGRHYSATSGLMTVEQPGADAPQRQSAGLVRLGLGLYGMYPSAALARTHASLDLRPGLRWTTRLAQVKTLPARHPVGYGLTYVTPREMIVGIVPQGYSDGYDRGLSNSGEALVGGERCPVLGRIAMNMFAIDLTGVPGARQGDEVVLLGDQLGERITAEEIAAKIGTINYEVTTRISPLLRRQLL